MTLPQQAAVTADPAFVDRVEMATVGAAIDIVGEVQGGLSQAVWDKRHALGVKVLRHDRRLLAVFVKAVSSQVGDVASEASITDASIDTQVAAVWDDIAGVQASD